MAEARDATADARSAADDAAEPPVVDLDNVEIVYDKHFLAVQGISMQARRGDIVALLGPNGAGKSTVLKMISGIGRSERGEVTRGRVGYDGDDVTNARAKEMVDRGVTHILEGRRVFEDLTVEENLRCGLYRSGRRLRFDRSDYALAFEYFPRLEEILDINAGYASGGEQQMLVIARALLSLASVEEVAGSRPFAVTVVHGPDQTEMAEERTELSLGNDGQSLSVGDIDIDLRLDDDEVLSGQVVNEGAEPLEEVVLQFELKRQTVHPWRRELTLDRLAHGQSVPFRYETSPPKLLLLDEPSLGLAPQLVTDIFETLVEINREEDITMIVADQNAKMTLEIADYGYVMENGQIELHDPADELMDREEIKEYYLGTSGGADSYKDIRHYKIRKRWS